MGKMSRDKGKRGEREFARICRDHGYEEASRGQQYCGIEGEDVVGLPGIHVEVKRVERLDLLGAVMQSQRDAGGKIPIVAHRKNDAPWLITMTSDDFFAIYSEYAAGVSV